MMLPHLRKPSPPPKWIAIVGADHQTVGVLSRYMRREGSERGQCEDEKREQLLTVLDQSSRMMWSKSQCRVGKNNIDDDGGARS